MKTVSISYENITLTGSFCPASEPAAATIIYCHGGGLLYGVRDDLPEIYQKLFQENGFHLLAIDYLLAPESRLPQIRGSVLAWIQWYLQDGFRELGLESPTPFFLFGRSAGAYLALQASWQLFSRQLPQPKGLLLFYGYPSLLEADFSKPNRFYRKLPEVAQKTLDSMVCPQPVARGPIEQRFSLYIYGRQTGQWISMCGTEEEAQAGSLSPEELAKLPPAFLTASSSDPDVPFGISKRMGKAIPGSLFKPVYNLEHDFDRSWQNPVCAEVYQDCIRWMKGRLA